MSVRSARAVFVRARQGSSRRFRETTRSAAFLRERHSLVASTWQARHQELKRSTVRRLGGKSSAGLTCEQWRPQRRLHAAQVRRQKKLLLELGVPDLSPEEVTERASRPQAQGTRDARRMPQISRTPLLRPWLFLWRLNNPPPPRSSPRTTPNCSPQAKATWRGPVFGNVTRAA